MIERSAAGFTVVVALAELFAGIRSTVSDETLAWLVIEPVVLRRDLDRDAGALPVRDRAERARDRAARFEQVPWEGVAESKVTPAGSVSVTVTPVALDGPALATLKRVGQELPGSTGSGASDLVSDRFADGLTLRCGARSVVRRSGSAVVRVDGRLVGDRPRWTAE